MKTSFSLPKKQVDEVRNIAKYLLDKAGSRYFCESFYGHPCPTSGKNYATANAFGGPSRPASLVAYPTRGMQHRYRNDSTRFRKACIFTTRKTLRENTCPIASGDYSTPCDKLSLSFSCKVKVLAWNSKE
jgi:hypothetical protein